MPLDVEFPNVTTARATLGLFRATPTTDVHFRIHTGGSVSTINHEFAGTGTSYSRANNVGFPSAKPLSPMVVH